MISIEAPGRNTRSKAPGGIQRASGVVHSSNFSNKQSQPNANRSHEGVFAFLGCQHENSEHQFTGQEHLPLVNAVLFVDGACLKPTSKKTPCATLIPGARVVRTAPIGPGSMQSTNPAATIPPRICAGKRQAPAFGYSARYKENKDCACN